MSDEQANRAFILELQVAVDAAIRHVLTHHVELVTPRDLVIGTTVVLAEQFAFFMAGGTSPTTLTPESLVRACQTAPWHTVADKALARARETLADGKAGS